MKCHVKNYSAIGTKKGKMEEKNQVQNQTQVDNISDFFTGIFVFFTFTGHLNLFLVVSAQLYKRVFLSVRWSVRWLVGPLVGLLIRPSVRPSVTHSLNSPKFDNSPISTDRK